MRLRLNVVNGCWITLGVFLLAGCVPPGDRLMQEESKQFLEEGMEYLDNHRYDRAIEAFEQALRREPDSAEAHFELGLIYYHPSSNYVSALYHLSEFESLAPRSPQLDKARQVMMACRLEIIRNVPENSLSLEVKDAIEESRRENAALRQQVQDLQARLAQRLETPPQQPIIPPADIPPADEPGTARRGDQSGTSNALTQRTHTIQAKETMFSIATRYGITAAALQSANPDKDPRRLRIGDTLIIPGSTP